MKISDSISVSPCLCGELRQKQGGCDGTRPEKYYMVLPSLEFMSMVIRNPLVPLNS